ncbi:MAG TPA: DUF3656 domain-containing protein [Candidatus Aquicultor sp.]|jgi:putative protease
MNKNLELLAPAGNRTAFNAALNSGADAIYVGIDKFSARRGADNFTIEELYDAIKDAHLKGVRVYVAFNTVVSDEELPSAIENLVKIYNTGTDAVIVQDWGVFKLVRELLPGIRLHASTQMNTHNVEMAKFIEEHGASRITLARELSIEEIHDICTATDIEIETFIHGALCFSYSGQCLFSSMVGNRSGNRGMCPQACRMSYELLVPGKKEEVWPTPGRHLMSTRDLAGIKLIPELAEAGVSALKIEGRMKSPEYVATVVRIYRAAIDRYKGDPDNYHVSDEEIEELKEAFSRGFTEGYMKGVRDGQLMSFERPSDRGVLIGRVTYLDVYTARLGIQLRSELCIGDEIEVWVSQGGRVRSKVGKLFVDDKAVDCAPQDSKAVVIVEGKRHRINTGDRVFRVHNEKLVRAAREVIKRGGDRKIPIHMSARIEIDKPLEFTARVAEPYGNETSEVTSGFLAERGEHRSLTDIDVIAQLNRLGSTEYEVESWDIKIEEGAMVPLGKLNELRRDLIERLDAVRLKAYRRQNLSARRALDELDDIMAPQKTPPKKGKAKPILAADVSTVDQARSAAVSGADWIYIRPGLKRLEPVDFERLTDLRSATGVRIAYATGNILHEKEITSLMKFLEENNGSFNAVLADNFGLFEPVQTLGLPVFLDYHVNTFNRVAARFFMEEVAARICLSPELTLDQVREITSSISWPFEVLAHGWLEVMTTEHCVPSASKKSCATCAYKSFYIKDEKGFKFPIEQDSNCRSHIYNSRELYLLPNTGNIIDAGVSSIRLLLNRYEEKEVRDVVAAYREAIDLITAGNPDITSVLKKADNLFHRQESTTGHFFREVQ